MIYTRLIKHFYHYLSSITLSIKNVKLIYIKGIKAFTRENEGLILNQCNTLIITVRFIISLGQYLKVFNDRGT